MQLDKKWARGLHCKVTKEAAMDLDETFYWIRHCFDPKSIKESGKCSCGGYYRVQLIPGDRGVVAFLDYDCAVVPQGRVIDGVCKVRDCPECRTIRVAPGYKYVPEGFRWTKPERYFYLDET